MKEAPAFGTADPQWYQRLFEANPVPMWIYDLQTLAFLDVNEVACQKYGYTRDEFLAMTIRDIRPPEDIGAVEQSVRLTPAEVFSSGVWRHRLRDGRLIYVEITSHELLYRGRAARFVAPLDMTRRVQAEEALREREAALAHAQRLARLAHVVSRPDGTFQSWSDTLPEIAGCPQGSLPRSCSEWIARLVHEEDRERVSSTFAHAMNTGTKAETEYRLVQPGGQVVHLAQVLEPIQRDAVVGGSSWFSTLKDVTVHKTAEAAMRNLNDALEQRVALRTQQLETSNLELLAAMQAAERANRAKSDFLTRMSHELRTPLNAVIGFSRLLAEPGHHFAADRQAAFNGHILQAGEHLLALANELMNLARIEAGEIDLHLEPLPLGRVLAECIAIVEPQASARGLTVHFTAAHDKSAVVADRTRLKQVVLNLLSNAVKYNRPQGELRLTVRSAGLRHLRIEVADTGPGLTAEQLDHLFEAFNRLGRSQHGDGGTEGTGLGLVVTRHLVELMGGRIGVTSTPGAGSCFWVDLVAAGEGDGEGEARVDAMALAGAEPPADARDRHTVLLVEDDVHSQELVRAQLSERGDLRLVTAANGREGVALAIALQPAVILMDNHMPELTGRQAFELLAQVHRTADIPVIAISAGGDSPIADRADLQWFRRVAKPFRGEDLMQAIDEAIHRRR